MDVRCWMSDAGGKEKIPATLPALFFWQVARRGDHVALRHKKYGIWHRISWNEYGEQVREVAYSLFSLDLKKGENVSVLGENRPEWLFCHLGIMASGGVTCGIYPTSAPEQIAYLLQHSGSRLLFVENEEQLDKALGVLPETPVERVIVWDPKGLWGFSHPQVLFFDECLKRGRDLQKKQPGLLEGRLDGITPGETAMIIYTSGTTGPPKGAMLSHHNILAVTEALLKANPADETDEVISYLPLAHIYENLISVFQAVRIGYTVNFVESLDTLFQNVREVSPTIFASVPRIWEKLASMIDLRMEDSTFLKRSLYHGSVALGRRYTRAKMDGQTFPWPLRFLYRLLYWTVLWPLKRQIGFERVRVAFSGAAPASPELFESYNALGIPLREGYGQTESSGVIAVNRWDRARWGTVGEPLEGVEVRIAEDGEILVRGPNVFKGYFKDQELTAKTLQDGWLHTGDVGALLEGFVRILDRKKDIIITAGGKNITPAYLENKLKFSPYIQDAVVIGDRRKYLVALILIDEDNVTKYAQDRLIPFTTFADLTQAPEIQKLIAREVEKVNKTLSSVETIKRFALLPRRFYEEEGDVTPTKKVKRRSLEKRYADLISSLYPE